VLQDDVDVLDEARDVALARATQYQQSLWNYHSSRVRPWSFVVGDLVLTQTRWAWKTRVAMGGTLHCDRSDTRRSLSTTRQENGAKREWPMECRATTTVLHVGTCYSVMAPEKMVACSWRGSSKSLCVVNDQPVGNPKRKVWWV
jgi:hypothetical protein